MSGPTHRRCAVRGHGVLAGALLAAALVTPASAASVEDPFVAAMRLYHDDRYAAAYGRLADLADSGHAEAARIALLMLRHGPALYRSHWSATREQVQHWLELASRRQRVLVADGGD